MAEKDLQAELDKLRADIETLRGDISGVASAIKEAGATKAHDLKAEAAVLAEKAKEQIKEILEAAVDKSKKGKEAVEHKVGEHPFVTMVAAFGIGFLVAKLIDRDRR